MGDAGGFTFSAARCDGSAVPRLPIYFDCTDALAAYAPRPELEIESVAPGPCPVSEVAVRIVNTGCADHDGAVTLRVVPPCAGAPSIDVIVSGPVPRGGVVDVVIPLESECDGLVMVTVDPDDAVIECSEVAGGGSCGSEAVADARAADVECCAADLQPRGRRTEACAGQPGILDGSGSTAPGCASAEYRWLRADGSILRDWSSQPDATAWVEPCPREDAYVLEMRCPGEPCVARTEATLFCATPVADAGRDVLACAGETLALDASATTGCTRTSFRWLREGVEVRAWSGNPRLDLSPFECTDAGTYRVEARCVGASCISADEVAVGCAAATPGEAADLRVARVASSILFTWRAAMGPTFHRVVRGTLLSLWTDRRYDHAADAASGAGTCRADTLAWSDPDDARTSDGWYYLVVGATSCTPDGSAGWAAHPTGPLERPPRAPTASCP